MLELKKVSKVYNTGEFSQRALDQVSINFRENEFASILGPSGSGKTTLLNIIGGLDQYTSGNLVINGVSTKDYKDRNWDTYRNYRVGFVFQNYNLITHQSILSNVELALTLSGVSKKEREERAREALIKVGLEKHINKKPSQLSGGQMQRVAIARALVNDPDIILADEPTGALDTETSIQIMNILKEVAKNKLVIMVTHNPDLAQEYSTRIIKLRDGKVIGDSNPYDGKEKVKFHDEEGKKTSMSFFTALSLSFNNLMTKKGRTILVSFAGSIGIIGIALIMSLSNGFQNYIDDLQEETLSSYPLTITSETADMTSMLLSMVSGDGSDDKSGKVTEKQYITSMFTNIESNDLKSFKGYIEKNNEKIKNDISNIKYTYSVSPYIYTIDASDTLSKINPSSLMSAMYSDSISNSIYSSYSSIFNQMMDDKEKLDEQYNVLAGKWPSNYDEMIIVLSEANSISDLLVYSLGLRKTDELSSMITKIMAGEKVEIENKPLELTYEDLMNIDLRLINQSDLYKYNSKYSVYEDMSSDKKYMSSLYDKALKLKIVGVVAPKKSNSATMTLSPGVAYTSDLTKYVIDNASKSDIVKKQLANKEVDVFSNTRFDDEKNEANMNFEDLITIDKDMLSSAFGINLNENDIKNTTSGYMDKISSSITTNTSPAKETFLNTLSEFTAELVKGYIENPKVSLPNPYIPNQIFAVIYYNDVESIVSEYMNSDSVKKKLSELESSYVIPADVFKSTYSSLLTGYLQGYISAYYENDTSFTTDENNKGAVLIYSEDAINSFVNQMVVVSTAELMASKMTEAVMQKNILTDVGTLTNKLMSSVANSFNVDQDKIASAFKFDLSEEEVNRIMSAMMSGDKSNNATANLVNLGYQDLEEPTSISFYFSSFDGKENFLKFISDYNDSVDEEKEINYTDVTGLLMTSVKKVVNTVSYVLIAFVSISLVVSSIMIAIITYISVLERTKEIGILRAVGASKKDITRVFNAETVIEGILSGVFGVGITLLLNIPINIIINNLIDVANMSKLPFYGGLGLLILSIFLNIIAGSIPSKMASKKDPVEALRSE